MHQGLKKKETSWWGFKGNSKMVVMGTLQKPSLELRNIPVLSLNQLQRKTAYGQSYATARSRRTKDRHAPMGIHHPLSHVLVVPNLSVPAVATVNTAFTPFC